jgi:ribosomal protein L11 methyltransferase
VRVPADRAEEARAVFVDLAPQGFEERDDGLEVELAAYVGEGDARRFHDRFPGAAEEALVPGWEDAWRAFHRPVRTGRLWIGPPWETPDGDALAVVIDPGRAFGTGAHPTTRLSLELLQTRPPGSLLDVGCGSGVLAIAAAKLGFAPVTAVDSDPVAVQVTLANAAANAVQVRAEEADALAGRRLPAADLAVANIALGAVEALAGRVRATSLITSGYLERDGPDLPGWTRVDRREADGWAADLFVPDTRDRSR